MDATIADEKSDDVEILIKNWKKIPVIGTQVLMSNFPYAIAPWEHWNLMIDELKKMDESTKSEELKKIESNSDSKTTEESSSNDEFEEIDKDVVVPSKPIQIPIRTIEEFSDYDDVDWDSDNE